MEYDPWGRTYAQLTPEEREIVDKRIKEKRAKEASEQELSLEELEQQLGGTKFRYDEETYGGMQR